MLPTRQMPGHTTPLIGLHDLLRGMSRTPWANPAASFWNPAFELEDSEAELILRAELPGLRPEDVEITVDRGLLTISGEKQPSTESSNGTSGRRWSERAYGKFTRTMRLPEGVDADRAEARFEHGVLHLTLPKSEQAKPRRIQVTGAMEASRS